jgi:hypothetical protein
VNLIFFPRLPNGNVLWECDNCGVKAEVSEFDTCAVALVCECDLKARPVCNAKWYYDGLYRDRKLKDKYEKD